MLNKMLNFVDKSAMSTTYVKRMIHIIKKQKKDIVKVIAKIKINYSL